MFNSHEIERLYSVEKWPVAKIAKHLGVSKVSIYTRLKSVGHRFTVGRKSKPIVSAFSREEIVRVYNSENGSMKGTADRLGISVKRLNREMEFHSIPKTDIHWRVKRCRPVENLKIGEAFEFTPDDPDIVSESHIYKYAKNNGIRLVIRKKGGVISVIRTPLLSADSVRRMSNSGKTVKEIATTFLVAPKKIRQLLEKSEVTEM